MPRKTNNSAAFIVALKQNNSEGFTANGFSMILSSQTRPINFAQNALGLRNFGHKNQLQYLKKISGYVKSGIQIYSLSSRTV